MSLECGKKLENPKETHANTARTYKLLNDVVQEYTKFSAGGSDSTSQRKDCTTNQEYLNYGRMDRMVYQLGTTFVLYPVKEATTIIMSSQIRKNYHQDSEAGVNRTVNWCFRLPTPTSPS
ncbi:unnamed protein product [Ranitomeya imitator]|uniref:Uncharacterized protein n=1 Tax=Ranitomeya imitator TaxID=111125 RepID=A0ABN9LTY4_9NEOB|nr:unnamed protein product [Ranitomeya imitator]